MCDTPCSKGNNFSYSCLENAGGQSCEHSWLPNEEGYATADVESDQLHVPASWPPVAARLEKSWPPEAARLEGCGRFTGHVRTCHQCKCMLQDMCGHVTSASACE